jgi:hypothetical protein
MICDSSALINVPASNGNFFNCERDFVGPVHFTWIVRDDDNDEYTVEVFDTSDGVDNSIYETVK